MGLAKFRRLLVRSAFTLLLALAASSEAAEFQGHARLWVGNALDTNARRDFVSRERGTQADLFLFGLGQLDGLLRLGEHVRISGAYDVSGRKFLFLPTEDTIVQAAQLEATVSFLKYFAFGLSGRARDRRGAERDYTDLVGGAVLDFQPDPSVDVRASINAHRFLFYNRFAYSFWGPDGTLSMRYRFNRKHSISAFGSYNPRTYNGIARARPGPEGSEPPPEMTRTDAVFGGGVSYSFRGPLHFSFSYSYFDQSSNSFGESVQRHRLSATAGFRLPWDLMLLTSLTWQPAVFPEGVYLSPDLTVLEEDENVSSLTLKLVKPIGKYFDLDVRYAGYLGFLPGNEFIYLRHVISIGVAVNF
jgi:hypothetical protein